MSHIVTAVNKNRTGVNRLLRTLSCRGWVRGGEFLGGDRVFLIVSETIAC